MTCTTCGSELRPVVTDMPFKVGPQAIVILKSLPVLQCHNCGDYLIEDPTMARVEQILARADRSAELEVVQFAA